MSDVQHTPRYEDRFIDELCSTGTLADLETVQDNLHLSKLRIEGQLALAASGQAKPGWNRGSAIMAKQIIEAQLLRVKARHHKLHNRLDPAAIPPQSPKKPPLRRVVVLTGDACDVARQLEEYMAGGWSPLPAIACPGSTSDSLVVIQPLRGDYLVG
jgi:hypothetical protein